jgi:UDP-galactopyranose mutase
MSYDFVVVGAGMAGAVFAREATDHGKKVLIIDKAPIPGGACASRKIAGIDVHLHGPHVFHTQNRGIWRYVHRFADFLPLILRMKSMSRGRIYSFPINLMTLNQLWGVQTPSEAERLLELKCARIENPSNLEEWALANLGEELYERFIYGYTLKQWGRNPSTLPACILRRIPVRLNFNDNHFVDAYQGVPIDGYSEFFESLLEGIEVRLGVDYFQDRERFDRMGQIVYTGRLDQFFDYRFGELPFRTVRFETQDLEGDYQGCPVVTYPDLNVSFTRITEHKHFGLVVNPRTIISREFSEEGTRDSYPHYPINDAANTALAERYLRTPTSALFIGRAARYQYLDMDQAIAQAIALARNVMSLA